MDKEYKIKIDTNEATANVDKLANSIDKAQQQMDKWENITKVAAGVTGAFQTAAGAMTLLGVESEEATEAMAKLQSVMAMTQGFKAIAEGSQSFFKLQKATDAAGKSMGGLKKALIGTGIGAIVVVVASLIANFEDLRKEFKWLDVAATELEKVWDGLTGVFKNAGGEIKALGNLVLKSLVAPIKAYIETLKGVGKIIKSALKGNFDDIPKIAEETAQNVKKPFEEVGDAAHGVGEEFSKGYTQGVEDGIKKPEVKEKIKAAAKEYIIDPMYLLTDEDLEKIFEENHRKWKEKLDKWLPKYSTSAKEAMKKNGELGMIRVEIPASVELDEKDIDTKIGELQVKFEKASDKFYSINDGIQGYGSALSDMFGSIASNFDESSEEYKALAITQTVINTLMGMAQAVSTAMELGPIAGPIMGAINAAAVLASGIAAITQIKSADENTNPSSVSSSMSAVSRNSTATATSPTQSLPSVSGDSAATSDTKVYVTTTDINKSQKQLNNKKVQTKF